MLSQGMKPPCRPIYGESNEMNCKLQFREIEQNVEGTMVPCECQSAREIEGL